VTPQTQKEWDTWNEWNNDLSRYQGAAALIPITFLDALQKRSGKTWSELMGGIRNQGTDLTHWDFLKKAHNIMKGGDAALDDYIAQITPKPDPGTGSTVTMSSQDPLAPGVFTADPYDPLGVKTGAPLRRESPEDLLARHGLTTPGGLTPAQVRKALTDWKNSGFPIDHASSEYFDLVKDASDRFHEIDAQREQEQQGAGVSKQTEAEWQLWKGWSDDIEGYQLEAALVKPRFLKELETRTGERNWGTLIDRINQSGYDFSDPRFINKANSLNRRGDQADWDRFIDQITPKPRP